MAGDYTEVMDMLDSKDFGLVLALIRGLVDKQQLIERMNRYHVPDDVRSALLKALG